MKEAFGIKGIPQLHILSPSGQLITAEGRALVAKDKVDAVKTWCAQVNKSAGDAFSTEEDF